MIKHYLNQTIVWRQRVSIDKYGAPAFTDKVIKVRWEFKRRLVRNKEGREVTSEHRVFCTAPVEVGDMFQYRGTDWEVISIRISPALDGSEGFREVAL